MTFFEFVCKRFDEEQGKPNRQFIYDMAPSARLDVLYPRETDDRREIMAYLKSQMASSACIDCFEQAFDEYERMEQTAQ